MDDMLLDLRLLSSSLSADYQSKFKEKDVMLPVEFKEKVQSINDCSINYNLFSTVVTTRGELKIYFPNQWFYIASYFIPLYSELLEYKRIATSLFNDKKLVNLHKTQTLDEEDNKLLNGSTYSNQDKERMAKFVTDYSWWGGGKTIDRSDFYASPILNVAKLVNASQSYIADLCAFLSDHKDLSDILDEYYNSQQLEEDSQKYLQIINDNLDEAYTDEELGGILNNWYKTAPEDRASNSIRAFGIKYGRYISNAAAIIRLAPDVNSSYSAELSKGIALYNSIENKEYGLSFYKEMNQPVSSHLDLNIIIDSYDKYLAALKTKPFLLLAGISGTGKSRLVQELAYMTCKRDGVLDKDAASPGNYCLIEVKPNWHDSTELLGYYSSLSKKYELTPFIRFVYKAIQNKDVPFFVCLDEMNLAPVEQYFAEYLSVLETRKIEDDGSYSSEPLLKSEIFNNCEPKPEDKDYEIIKELKENGLRLPQNLFVIGTVNMDDTTHQFSRKVIDRAFTIEMDGSDLKKMFEKTDTLNYQEKPLEYDFIKPEFVSAAKVLETYTSYTETIKEKVPEFLDAVNERFKNTPFRVSYRVQNEMILYIASLIRQSEDPSNIDIDSIISEASLSILMEKILPRVEGDDKLLGESLENLKSYILSSHSEVNQGDESSKTDSFLGITLAKLEEMQERLKSTYFTSFFS